MSNTIEHRVSTYSKYALNQQQSQDEREAKERRSQEINQIINKRNPNLAIEKKKIEESMERCRDALLNSYLKDFSKFFDKFMLWPFVPGLKTGEAVTAGARLVLFCCMTFGLAVIASKKLSPDVAKSFEFFDIKMDINGVLLTVSILIIPNIFYYLIQKVRYKMCLSKNKKKTVSSQESLREAENIFDHTLKAKDTSNLYQYEGRIASENLIRQPVRQGTSLGGHPGVAGIM